MFNLRSTGFWYGVPILSQSIVSQGASSELSLKGTLRAKFCPASNKLLSAIISFDTGVVASQLQRFFPSQRAVSGGNDAVSAAEAAEVAASEADAILDSLQMPHIESAVPASVTVVPPSSCSESSSGDSVGSMEKDDSSDENPGPGMTTRRVLRRKD